MRAQVFFVVCFLSVVFAIQQRSDGETALQGGVKVKDMSKVESKSTCQCDDCLAEADYYRNSILPNCTAQTYPDVCTSNTNEIIDALTDYYWGPICQSPSPSPSPASSFGEPPNCTCLAYGGVQPNVLVFETCQMYSDTEGQLYCGGDTKLSGHSVGDKLTQDFADAVVVAVGGKLSWSSGRLYVGRVVACETDIHSSVQINEASVSLDCNYFDFTAARTYYEGVSSALCQKAASGTINMAGQGTQVITGGNQALDIYYINCSDLRPATSLEFTALSESATAVLNFLGATCNFRMGGVIVPRSSRIIFNFCEATTLELVGTPMPGSLLAPFADVRGSGGVVVGQLIARSFSGQTQQNYIPCDGCLSNYV
jgi:choice-of-anchor A domain-containing protein